MSGSVAVRCRTPNPANSTAVVAALLPASWAAGTRTASALHAE
jgi:hypothetical protein